MGPYTVRLTRDPGLSLSGSRGENPGASLQPSKMLVALRSLSLFLNAEICPSTKDIKE